MRWEMQGCSEWHRTLRPQNQSQAPPASHYSNLWQNGTLSARQGGKGRSRFGPVSDALKNLLRRDGSYSAIADLLNPLFRLLGPETIGFLLDRMQTEEQLVDKPCSDINRKRNGFVKQFFCLYHFQPRWAIQLHPLYGFH